MRLVTQAFLKSNTNIGNNVDATAIDYLEDDCLRIWIKPLIGIHFFDILKNKYDNGATLNSYEEEVLTLVRKSIAWYVASDAIEDLSFKVTNKGSQRGFSDFSNASTDESVKWKSQKATNKFKEYLDLLAKYLKENKKSLPDFDSDLNESSIKDCKGYSRDLGISFC